MALADIYQVTVNMVADSEEVKNIYYYEKLAGGLTRHRSSQPFSWLERV